MTRVEKTYEGNRFPNSDYKNIIQSIFLVCRVVPEYNKYLGRINRLRPYRYYQIKIGVGKEFPSLKKFFDRFDVKIFESDFFDFYQVGSTNVTKDILKNIESNYPTVYRPLEKRGYLSGLAYLLRCANTLNKKDPVHKAVKKYISQFVDVENKNVKEFIMDIEDMLIGNRAANYLMRLCKCF